MNYKRIILAALLIPFVSLWEGVTKGYASSPAIAAVIAPPAFLPSSDLSLSDLDVRDAQNREILDPAARSELLSIFVENLYQVAVAPVSREMTLIWDMLDQFSLLIHKSFYASSSKVFNALLAICTVSKKRFVHNVDKLWISFSDGVWAARAAPSRSAYFRTIFLFNLRC